MRQLCTCVHINDGASEHANLTGDEIFPHLHFGKAHQQVDDKKRKGRNQSDRNQIKDAVALDAFVDIFEPLAKFILDPVAQQIAGREEGNCRANGGGKGDNDRADHNAK